MLGRMITALIPIALSLYLMVTMAKMGNDTMDSSKNMASAVGVKSELEAIKQLVLNHKLTYGSFPQENFAEFLRESMKVKSEDRDVAQDVWGHNYGLYVDKEEGYFVLYSIGPDGVNETDDDIEVEEKYRT